MSDPTDWASLPDAVRQSESLWSETRILIEEAREARAVSAALRQRGQATQRQQFSDGAAQPLS